MIVVVLLFIFCFDNISSYCIPTEECWPNATQWQNFGDGLNGALNQLKAANYPQCVKQGDDAYNISATGEGMCMQYHDCSKKFCNATSTEWNIPSYSVEVQNVNDVIKTFQFANQHNISVTVKTSGHSYSGSSMGEYSILIWMYNFTKYLDIKASYNDSCGQKNYSAVIKVGGGQTWGEVYNKLKSDYHIVGGGGLTVSAAGGWLQGCGLSAMSRKYGIGIDNVIDFEVVLTNGSHVKADACLNADLFWALRGGGGGSFGVVTSVHYRLHPVEPVVSAYLQINYAAWNVLNFGRAVGAWINFWTDKSPYLDNRWGGYWTFGSAILYFVGNLDDAMTTFGNDLIAFRNSLPDELKAIVYITMTPTMSYYDSRGGDKITTDKTGQQTFNIASRLIPREFVVNFPNETKETLNWLAANGYNTFNYFLGGAVNDISGDYTAVHPAMRKAVWQIETFGEKMIQKLREVVKDTGAGFNHASKLEPDWRNAFWGSNLQRLQSLKKQYDPENRLNCWHCIGYQGDEPKGSKSPPTTPVSSSTTKITSTSKITTTQKLSLSSGSILQPSYILILILIISQIIRSVKYVN